MSHTILTPDETAGLGEIKIAHPAGTFALTPASRISIHAIVKHQHLLSGLGIDWGSGSGCLAIVAAKVSTVNQVVGLDISAANVQIAAANAVSNGVGEKIVFMCADSYHPLLDSQRRVLETYQGQVSFVLANPPSSEGDDGFEYRRLVLGGGRAYLRSGGLVFLSISAQYGSQRIAQLCREIAGYSHEGLLATTDWVPFDLGRPDLRHCLELYAQEEVRGGFEYSFVHPHVRDERVDARSALRIFQETGQSPLSQWQTHLFRYEG